MRTSSPASPITASPIIDNPKLGAPEKARRFEAGSSPEPENSSKRRQRRHKKTSAQNEPKLPQVMTYKELDTHIAKRLTSVGTTLQELKPYLLEMRELLFRQGSRTDIYKKRGVPAKLTWQAWLKSKEEQFGSVSTVKRLLAEKEPCPQCSRRSGHAQDCPAYVRHARKPLSALESKFVDSAKQQELIIQHYYTGTDPHQTIKAIAKNVPTHDQLEQYETRGRAGLNQDEFALKAGAEVVKLRQENEILTARLSEKAAEFENLAQQKKTVTQVPDDWDKTITARLAGEPDCELRARMATEYFQTVAARQFPPDQLTIVSVRVEIAGRNHRIMPGDFLRKKAESSAVLCKCVGIGDSMQRRRVSEWVDGKWAKDHIVQASHESLYTVLTQEAARALEPRAFAKPSSKGEVC